MKISVIIPSYKPQSYIWECLDSLCRQTFPKDDFEVILVLNGCKEPYDGQLREYISNHSDVQWKYIQTDEGGVSNARNIALDVANGEYITFIDDDDFVSLDYLAELYGKASEDTIVLCYPLEFKDGTCDYKPYRITKSYESNEGKDTIHFTEVRPYFSGPVYKLIHRDIIARRRFLPRLKNGEDTLFMFLISDKFKDVRFTSKNAVYYRRNRTGSAVTRRRTRFDKIKSNYIQIFAYLKIYLHSPRDYNFSFFCSRIGGALLGMFL